MSKSQRKIFAGIVWILIGGMLAYRGFHHWNTHGQGDFPTLALLIGVLIGAAKGFFVLKKSSTRIIHRIDSGPEKAPFWQVWPPLLLLLIPLMIAMGFGLRYWIGEEYPQVILAVYVGIGAALVTSSLPFFKSA